MSLSRRRFLQTLGAGSAAFALNRLPVRAQSFSPPEAVLELERDVLALLDGEDMALELRRIDWDSGQTDFRILYNAFRLLPIASSFKAFVVLYYLTMTPQDRWQTDEESAAYRVAVFSNNPLTGDLIVETANYVSGAGNAVEKFNDWIMDRFYIRNGIYNWDWPLSPTIGQSDSRFAPSETRAVTYRGEQVAMDNVFYVSDLAELWGRLLALDPLPNDLQGLAAAQKALELFAIPAAEYPSPIERAWGPYIGKDGVIPAADSPVGRVTTDAGIIRMGESYYVVSAMSIAGEYRLVETLRAVLARTQTFEALR